MTTTYTCTCLAHHHKYTIGKTIYILINLRKDPYWTLLLAFHVQIACLCGRGATTPGVNMRRQNWVGGGFPWETLMPVLLVVRWIRRILKHMPTLTVHNDTWMIMGMIKLDR